MNANDRFYARDAQVDAAAITPLPNSRKIYVEGSRPDPTSAFGRARLADPELATLRFDLARRPLRARPGANVTQMHYARRGIVTPEMEFVCLLYTSPSPRDRTRSRMPSSA